MLCWTSVKYSSSFQIDKEVEKLLELKALKMDSSEAPAGKWVLKCPKVADQVCVCVIPVARGGSRGSVEPPL